MPLTLDGINSTPRSDTLNVVCEALIPPVASIGAAAANTTVQAQILLPYQYKIRKVSVLYLTVDNVTGTDSFNLVVGSGAYSQGNAAPNDNSFDPSSTTTVGVNGIANTGAVLGGLGYPTNVAVAGQSVFAADVPFGTAAGTYNASPPNTSGSGTFTQYTGWITLATTGGYGIFVPSNYDAVYPENIPLTIRATTIPTTGAVTGLVVRLAVTPIRKRPAPIGSDVYGAIPSLDY
jgi:hypothetical protein